MSSNPNSKLSNSIGGATAGSLIAPQICNCPCHSSGNEFPCGAMCWHPGEDQFGLPISYDHASLAQLLKAAIVRGISAQAINSNVWEALFLAATEASTGVHTPVAANDAYEKLRKWIADLLTTGE